jgi:hypothetical protein
MRFDVAKGTMKHSFESAAKEFFDHGLLNSPVAGCMGETGLPGKHYVRKLNLGLHIQAN